MRDYLLVNPSGIPGHFMAIDMNIEHLIGYLKVSATSPCDWLVANNTEYSVALRFEGHLLKLG